MTLAVSLGGLTLYALLYVAVGRDSERSLEATYLVFSLPFWFGAAISVVSMRKQTRILLYWLTAAAMVLPGALTLFGGVGLYYGIAIIFFLVAAWMENESGEATVRRRGNVTTNRRLVQRG
jgi:hypothetical protein